MVEVKIEQARKYKSEKIKVKIDSPKKIEKQETFGSKNNMPPKTNDMNKFKRDKIKKLPADKPLKTGSGSLRKQKSLKRYLSITNENK